MARKNAHVLGKNPQIYVNAFRDANGSPFGTGKSNGNELYTPYFDCDIEVWTDYFGNSYTTKQIDNRQAFGAAAKRIDTKQGKALNLYL